MALSDTSFSVITVPKDTAHANAQKQRAPGVALQWKQRPMARASCSQFPAAYRSCTVRSGLSGGEMQKDCFLGAQGPRCGRIRQSASPNATLSAIRRQGALLCALAARRRDQAYRASAYLCPWYQRSAPLQPPARERASLWQLRTAPPCARDVRGGPRAPAPCAAEAATSHSCRRASNQEPEAQQRIRNDARPRDCADQRGAPTV